MYTTPMQIGGYEIQVPFVTTSSDHIKTILTLAQITSETRAIDLGSGDGRMVMEFGKAGAIVHGYEVKKQLVKKSQQRIKDAGLSETVFIHHESFWEADLSSFNLIYLYGMQSILGRLEKKLDNELKPGTKVISNIFRFPHWKVKREKDNVYLYIAP